MCWDYPNESELVHLNQGFFFIRISCIILRATISVALADMGRGGKENVSLERLATQGFEAVQANGRG